MSDFDNFQYESSILSGETGLSNFYKVKNFSIPDVNNGQYASGEVQFSMPSLSTQDAHCNLSDSYIQFPYSITVSADQVIAGAEKAVSLKGSFLSLVSSFSLRIDNQQVLTKSDFNNIPMHFDIISKSTANDTVNYHEEINFALDDEQTADYIASVGEYNLAGNTALVTRNAKIGYNPADARRAKFTDINKTTRSHKSNVVVTAQLVTYNVLVSIPLKHLSPVFAKAQLVKGAFIELYMNVNSGSASFTVTKPSGTAGQEAVGLAEVGAISTSPKFEVLPFMIDPTKMTCLRANGSETVTTVTVTGAISTNTNLSLKSAIFHAKLYQMKPEVESSYASSVPSKKIDYVSYHVYTQKAVATTGKVRLQIINSAQKMRHLIIHTCIAESINGSTTGATPALANGLGVFSPLASPFSSAPLTCCPEGSFSSFQVYVSGKPMFESPMEYSYEMFKEQYRNSNLAIDGDMSGLLNEKSWSEGYGYIFIDLMRKKNDAEDLVNQSLEIEFYNNTTCPIDVRCFLAQEETIELTTQTGKVVRS